MSVQTSVQYLFIHKVMVEYMEEKLGAEKAAQEEQEKNLVPAEPTLARRGSVFAVEKDKKQEAGRANSAVEEDELGGLGEAGVHYFKTKTFTRETACNVCEETLNGVANQVR